MLLSSPAKTEPAFTMAVASNFQLPLEQLLSSSEQWQNQNIRIVVGSSGSLYAQAINGAPFDMFLSADSYRPQALVEQGLAEKSSTYALGQLALWPLEQSLTPLAQLQNLRGKLAIANPKLAPFGASALAYIQNTQLSSHLHSKLVFGNNVTQAFQFVDSGNASLGILATSSLIQAHRLFDDPKYLNFWRIPNQDYPPIVQQLVIFKQSAYQAKAQALVEFLLSPSTQIRLQALGYGPLKGGDSHE